jgi:phenylpyruvate tautomerase PptA (4-oxalocrotonate tautomerase family)
MPLVMIDLLEGRSKDEIDQIRGVVHEAMVEHLDVPLRDRFQIVAEHSRATLHFDPGYLEIDRTEGFVLVRVILSAGRTTEAKRSFYAGLADLLADRVGLRREDLGVILVENQREDWSFGLGQASYLELPPEEWR